MKKIVIFFTISFTLVLFCMSSQASERGPVTNLPIPRYVSLKASEGNLRRGPAKAHRIDWVLKHKDQPLKILAEHEHWRRVSDYEGATGWIYYALLSGVRNVLVNDSLISLYRKPSKDSSVKAKVEFGAIGNLRSCNTDWCNVSFPEMSGWIEKNKLWGTTPDEIFPP
ncbi:MAG: SH3 domain-containing protein [Proteobacteria bacterium]|nr:SH3 domain-containing protein [Pseudomonadota bacterium]